MTEYKKISEKQVWLIVKDHNTLPKHIEYIGAYWDEDVARRVAASNIPTSSQSFSISLTKVTLHGLMVDRV